MNRGSFLRKLGLAVGGLAVGRNVSLETPLVEAVTKTASTRVGNTGVSFGLETLRASGGLCAPLTPIYDLPTFERSPIRDALPTFTAVRGGVTTSD